MKELGRVLPPNPSPGFGVADSGSKFFDFDTAIRQARELVLSDLPNDLIRLVYLASLRDCNTGHYFHPRLSQRYDVTSASHALQLCHEEVFGRLMAAPLSDYVAQLGGYIGYSNADKARVLATWKSLPAYRATVPFPNHLYLIAAQSGGVDTNPET